MQLRWTPACRSSPQLAQIIPNFLFLQVTPHDLLVIHLAVSLCSTGFPSMKRTIKKSPSRFPRCFVDCPCPNDPGESEPIG